MRRLAASLRVLLAAALAAGLGGAHALDLAPLEPGARWASGREGFMPGAWRPARDSGASLIPKSVLRLPNRWAPGSDIRVCFVGGSAQLRQRILTAAAMWFQYVNLKLVTGGPAGVDCEQGSRFEVRIGFAEPGTWAYIGSESLHPQLLKRRLTSMNLQGFDRSPPAEPRFTGIVLHEFGHALGLEHEHQSPDIACEDEYEWPKVYAFYRMEYGWEPPEVDRNVRPILANRSTYDWTPFDRHSIMVYEAKASLLKKKEQSVCWLRANDSLSPVDIQAARNLYAKGPTTELLGERIRALNESIPQLGPSALKDALTRQLQLSIEQIRR